jgi:uncharacterized membrane protein YjjP (DUF1212 family)
MNFLLRARNATIGVLVYLYKGLVLYFLLLAAALFYLDDGSWVNILIVSLGLIVLYLFIALSRSRRFSK